MSGPPLGGRTGPPLAGRTGILTGGSIEEVYFICITEVSLRRSVRGSVSWSDPLANGRTGPLANGRKDVKMRVRKAQIVKIHILKARLGLSDEEYGAALEGYGVYTSKDLSYEQAEDFIMRLINLLPKESRGNYLHPSADGHKDTKQKYDELGIRWNEGLNEHYATPKQLRMLEAMWMTSPVVRQKTAEAYLRFVKRITGKERLEWLLMSDVRKIKKAIESF